jgi:hypothetical protein
LLSQRIKCAESKSWCLGMLRECLVCSFMRLGVPFIAPRQLGAVECIPGRQFLPSVAWRTGQSGAPPDTVVRISFLIWRSRPLALWSRWRTGHCPVHTGQSGAPLPTIGSATCLARIARPTVGSPDSPVHTGQSGEL